MMARGRWGGGCVKMGKGREMGFSFYNKVKRDKKNLNKTIFEIKFKLPYFY